MERCAQTADVVLVASRSDPDRTYRVVLDDGDGNPACTCKGYAISRNRRRKGRPGSTEGGTCRHVAELVATRCTWRAVAGEAVPVDGRCPACGGPLAGDVEPDPATVEAARAALVDMRSRVEARRARCLR